MNFGFNNLFNFGNGCCNNDNTQWWSFGGCQQGSFNPIASLFDSCNSYNSYSIGYSNPYGDYSNCPSNNSIFTYDYNKYARICGDDYGYSGCCGGGRPNYAAEAGLGAINALFGTVMMCFAQKQADKQNSA